jgi:hypothetical protein
MNTEIVIVGTGAHARKLRYYAETLGLRVRAFVDSNPQAVSPAPEIPCMAMNNANDFAAGQPFLVGIGNASVRRDFLEALEGRGWIAISLIHPMAYVAKDAQIQKGTVICAGAIVETGVKIGVGVIVDVGVVVDHDCIVGDYVHLKPGRILLPQTVIDG